MTLTTNSSGDATCWWLLKQLYNKGLLYKGYTIQPYSPGAGTGLSSHELNQPGCYRDVKDLAAAAQKQLYIPAEWKNPWKPDSLLYKESDPDGKYTWSKTRSRESENFICYWDKGYGSKAPDELSKSNFYYVDIDDLLKKAESFYALNIGRLAFCNEAHSNVSKYKMKSLLNSFVNY